MKRTDRRWRMMADTKIQGLLCLRVVAYWVVCQLSIAATTFSMALLMDGSTQSSGSIWNFIVPGLIVSTLILPMALLDLLFFSNRFAGPLLNIRRKLQQLIEQEATETKEFRIRKGDFYADLCDQLNLVRSKVIAAESENNKHETAAEYGELAVAEAE